MPNPISVSFSQLPMPLQLAFRLRDDQTAGEVLKRIELPLTHVEVDGLVELVFRQGLGHHVRTALTWLNQHLAHEACQPDQRQVILETFVEALSGGTTSRHEAVKWIDLSSAANVQRLQKLIESDSSWMVRQESVVRIANLIAPAIPEDALFSIDDPHWRVRHTIIQSLLNCRANIDEIDKAIEHHCDLRKRHGKPLNLDRVLGLKEYVRFRRGGLGSIEGEADQASMEDDPIHQEKFWSWDPAVLSRNLNELTKEQIKEIEHWLPRLLGNVDERVRKFSQRSLINVSDMNLLVECGVKWLADPREPAFKNMTQLISKLDVSKLKAIQELFAADSSTTGSFTADLSTADSLSTDSTWEGEAPAEPALQQGSPPGDDSESASPIERRQLAKQLRDTNHESGQASLLALQQLQLDPNPTVRQFATTKSCGREFLERIEERTSWGVIFASMKTLKIPLWKLAPESVEADDDLEYDEFQREADDELASGREQVGAASAARFAVEVPQARTFGSQKWNISPLGLSGHYLLPVEGFYRGIEHGINFMFWEPNYSTMTDFYRKITNEDRRRIHLTAGSFQAEPKKIIQDVERTLRYLRIERLSLFLLFWVRSWLRVGDDVLECLETLQSAGKIETYSLSTHNRDLAIKAIEEAWNPVMVRHSAAHRGAETKIFPVAAAHQTSLITFNNTCYGRLLSGQGVGGQGVGDQASRVTATDCYRYSLSFPEVATCLTAPATMEQLAENLEVLKSPTMSSADRERMQRHGETAYLENKVFTRTVRAQ